MLFSRKKYKPDTTPERTFTAYIVKGNRQIIERQVTASKKFKVEEETYIIRDDCIFLKNIDGILRSVSYYREGNPNPYDFVIENIGISPDDLDRFYAEDFYSIIVNIRPDMKTIYMLLLSVINFCLCTIFTVWGLLDVYVF